MDRDDDLGALFGRITRRLLDAERPLLDMRGLSMWEYVVLYELRRRAAPSQLVLARRIGYDKTRLIALLDRLEERALIVRAPDPNDRRVHTITVTQAGAALVADARADIRAMEERLLAGLAPSERVALRTMLGRLASGEPSHG